MANISLENTESELSTAVLLRFARHIAQGRQRGAHRAGRPIITKYKSRNLRTVKCSYIGKLNEGARRKNFDNSWRVTHPSGEGIGSIDINPLVTLRRQ